jgi:branched-chain amino acid transport system ATP-binding protein
MGKTTLLRAICGLRPPVIAAGSVTLAGSSLLGLRPDEVARRGVALVPQGRRVFASLSVRENLTIAWSRPAPGAAPEAWDVDRVFGLFPRLAERARQLAGTLSGGEQQMLAIGRALMMQPRVLVMDEPSEGLAPAILEQLLDHMLRIRASGQALLIAEQNVDLALDMATDVSILGDDGTVAWSGPSEALRGQPHVLTELIGLATHRGTWT